MKNWTDDEIAILLVNYNAKTNSELAEIFPDRTGEAIYKKAYKLGLRKSDEMETINRSIASRKSHPRMVTRKKHGGYAQVYLPDHERADVNGFVMEHIVVFERETGVSVPQNCVVHHVNGIKDDNRIGNLCMMAKGAHTVHHHRGTKQRNDTKAILSKKAKERFADKRNHPFYKDVDADGMRQMRRHGASVMYVCKHYGISKSTYYQKMEEIL